MTEQKQSDDNQKYKTAIQWYQFGVGIAHICAFTSIFPQIRGLWGPKGIVPVTNGPKIGKEVNKLFYKFIFNYIQNNYSTGILINRRTHRHTMRGFCSLFLGHFRAISEPFLSHFWAIYENVYNYVPEMAQK